MNNRNKIHLLIFVNHILFILGMYAAISSGQYFYILVGFLMYLIIGLFGANIGLHRYLSHKSFKTSYVKDKILKYVSIFAGLGSPISWVALHRHHHKHSDSENDIQDPKRIGVLRSWFSLYPNVTINPKLVIDLIRDKDIQFIHKNYFLIIIATYSLMGIVNPILAIFMFSFPAVLCFHGAAAIGVLPHYNFLGYRLFDTKDESVNSPLASFLSLGEGWHNYHHYKPADHRHGHKWWELDPSAWIIEKFLKV